MNVFGKKLDFFCFKQRETEALTVWIERQTVYKVCSGINIITANPDVTTL